MVTQVPWWVEWAPSMMGVVLVFAVAAAIWGLIRINDAPARKPFDPEETLPGVGRGTPTEFEQAEQPQQKLFRRHQDRHDTHT